MTKAVIKMKDGNFINIEANHFEIEKGSLLVKNNEKLVAIVKVKELLSCHISAPKN